MSKPITAGSATSQLDAATEVVMGIMAKGNGGDEGAEVQEDDAAKKRANADDDAPARGKGKKEQDEDKPVDDPEKDEEYERSQGVSTVSEEALLKAAREIEALASTGDDDRRVELARKLAAGDLSKGEEQELATLLNGDPKADEPLFRSEEYSDVIKGDAEIRSGMDAVPWLERFAAMHVGALDELREGLSKAEDRAQRFDSSLAKSIGAIARFSAQQGRLIKAMADRIAAVEKQPVPRRSVSATSAAALHKSMGPPDGAPRALDSTTVEQAFNRMTRESYTEGRGGLSKSGEDLTEAWALFSKSAGMTGQGYLSPGVMQEIQTIVGRQ